MKTVVIEKPKHFQIKELPDPKPGEGEVTLEVAKQMGIDTPVVSDDSQEEALRKEAPLGFDIVFEATGSLHIVEKTFRFIKNKGKIVLYGFVPPEANVLFNPFDVSRKDLEIIGSLTSIDACMVAHELLSSGVIQVEHLISHRFPLQAWG